VTAVTTATAPPRLRRGRRDVSLRIASLGTVLRRIVSWHICYVSHRWVPYCGVSYRGISHRDVTYSLYSGVLYHAVSYRDVLYRGVQYHGAS
jgi:hypothetical protein